jgi:hypothetical protein
MSEDEIVAEIASLLHENETQIATQKMFPNLNLSLSNTAAYSISNISLTDIEKAKECGTEQAKHTLGLFNAVNSIREAPINTQTTDNDLTTPDTAECVKHVVNVEALHTTDAVIAGLLESLDDRTARASRMYFSPDFIAKFEQAVRKKHSVFTGSAFSDEGVTLDLLHNDGDRANLTINHSGNNMDKKRIKAVVKEMKGLGINLKFHSTDEDTKERNIKQSIGDNNKKPVSAMASTDLPKRKVIAAYCSFKDAAHLSSEYSAFRGDYINCGDSWNEVGRMMATMLLSFHISEIHICGHTATFYRAINNPSYSRIFRTAMDIFASIMVYRGANAVANGYNDSSDEVSDAFFIKRWLVNCALNENILVLGFIPKSKMVKSLVDAYNVVHVDNASGRLSYSMSQVDFMNLYGHISTVREEVFQHKLQEVMLELVGPKTGWYSWIQTNSAARGNGILDKIAAEFCKE